MTEHPDMTGFRRIDITAFQPREIADQAAPQLMWIEIERLVIDDRYQRQITKQGEAAIRAIAEDFRWSRFSPIMVAPVQGGLYAIIDGQHRAHAAAICGIQMVPATIALIAPTEQAKAFIDINTRRIQVSPHTVYRAALTAGEDWAVACDAAVSAAGCRLMSFKASTKDKKPGQVYAVTLIRRIVERGHAQAVTAGLDALLVFDPTSVAHFSDAILSPWLDAVSTTGETDRGTLIAALRIQRPFIALERADMLAKSTGQPKAVVRRNAFVSLIGIAQRETAEPTA